MFPTDNLITKPALLYNINGTGHAMRADIMRVRKIPHYTKPKREIIVVDEDDNEMYLSKIEKSMIENFSAIKLEKLVGLDQIYIELKIVDNVVTLAWDSMAGVSIECENAELREKIFKHLQHI